MVDLLDVNIEYALSQGRKKEAADLLRKRGGQLFKMIADSIDPDKLQRMGRPVKKDTSGYRAKQRAMIYEYYFLWAYYKKKKGWTDPATVAKGAVIGAHESGKTFFEEAHKRYGRQIKRRVEMELEINNDFPEWVKNY